MGQVAEQLQLEHFSQEGFLRLIDYVTTEITPQRVFFAQKLPIRRERIEIYPAHVFDVPLAGQKKMIFGNGNAIRKETLLPGDIFYCVPLTWKQPVWTSRHEMCCFVFNKEFVRLTYVDHHQSLPRGIRPQTNCFYHTQLPPSEPIRKVLKTLELLAAMGDSGGAAPELVCALFRLTRMQLANDRTPTFTKSQNTFQRIHHYLSENFHSPINRDSVANIFKLHPGHVSRLFLQSCGQTFSEVLHEMRMEHAAILLKNTDMLIAEITEQCGYLSPTFFTAAFKKYFGLPPGQFRNRSTFDDLTS